VINRQMPKGKKNIEPKEAKCTVPFPPGLALFRLSMVASRFKAFERDARKRGGLCPTMIQEAQPYPPLFPLLPSVQILFFPSVR